MRSKIGKDAVTRRPPAYTFGTRNGAQLLGEAGPGPGEYTTPISPSNSKYSRGPSHAFSSLGRNLSLRDTTPGPGHLNPRHIGPAHPAPTFHGSPTAQPRSQVPGPGAYSPDRADKLLKPNSPSFSIAVKHEEPGSLEVKPAPGSYNPRRPGSGSGGAKGVSLKFRHEDGMEGRELAALFGSPVPGQYGCAGGGQAPCGPAFTMGMRLKEKAPGAGVLGPGSYEFE